MTEQRQPTEAQWRLVAKVVTAHRLDDARKDWLAWQATACADGRWVLFYTTALGHGEGSASTREYTAQFRALHDYNDLARLVEAMIQRGWHITRTASRKGHSTNAISERRGVSKFYHAGTQIEATFWACVEALEAEEKQNAANVD